MIIINISFVTTVRHSNIERIKVSHYKADVGGQGQWKSRKLCLVLVRPDRQTSDSFFQKSGQNLDSRQNRNRQKPDRYLSGKFGHRLDTGQIRERKRLSADCPRPHVNYLKNLCPRLRESGQEFPKIRTKTTSGKDTNNAVRRRLVSDRTTPGQHHCS